MIALNINIDKEEAIQELEDRFDLTTDQLRTLSTEIRKEMTDGLSTDNKESAMAMLPSWITDHPTGQERGECIGLDLSASFVRVYWIQLHGGGRISTRQLKYTVPDTLKTGHIHELVDFMAECLDSFLTFINKSSQSTPLALGVCLAFPLLQTDLRHAYVIRWTKDYDVQGSDNKNIMELLQTAITKRRLPVNVEATLNSATSCLLAHCYRTLDTLLATTVSSGANAAYWEKCSDIHKVQIPSGVDEMIINTELGGFGDTQFHAIPHTLYDVRVNRQSINPGYHVYEKMVAGLYLGEIVRLIIVDFIDRRLLFDGQYSVQLNSPYRFDSAYMSVIEDDKTAELDDIKHIFEDVMNIETTTLVDRKMIKRICELVGTRAARLMAAGICAIITKRRALDTGLTITVDGNIYEHYSNFSDRVTGALREVYGSDADKINVGITRDGNGIGAGLAAMMVRSRNG